MWKKIKWIWPELVLMSAFIFVLGFGIYTKIQRQKINNIENVTDTQPKLVISKSKHFIGCKFEATPVGVKQTKAVMKSTWGMIQFVSKRGLHIQELIVRLRREQICCKKNAENSGINKKVCFIKR